MDARTRILSVALEEFAAKGEKGATIRGIADAAGVSAGLVQHHFPNKAALREACDAYAIDTIRDIKTRSFGGGAGDTGFLAVAMSAAIPIQTYLARALVDGSPRAAALFDDAVALTRDMTEHGMPGMNPPATDDPHAYAAVLTAFSFGMIVLHEHLSRSLGGNTLTPEGYPRLARAALDVFSHALVTPEFTEQARAALSTLMDDAPGDSDPPAP
ncbi:TetR/AcrR family transcriptional regulator [Actinomadura flavalba]|uniref:TetR/AcrR family transcriptional regulator n=1 Tax=Actinomadura flavalba TaxID=1120938 RepID=UPI00037A23C0|nr:TetR/AcrR family transcriptional regulator [Actinomadura flavalba]